MVGSQLRVAVQSQDLWSEHLAAQPSSCQKEVLLAHTADTLRSLAAFLACDADALLPYSSADASLSSMLAAWRARNELGSILAVSAGGHSEHVSASRLVAGASNISEFQIAEDWQGGLDDLEGAVSKDTGFVVIDVRHCGPALPLDEVVERVRSVAPDSFIFSIVQPPPCGIDPLDESGSDFVAADCYTWMGGCHGSSFCLANPRGLELLSEDREMPLLEAWNAAPFLALDAAIGFWGEIGLGSAQSYCESLADDAANLLRDEWGQMATSDAFPRGAIAPAVPLPDVVAKLPVDSIRGTLAEEGIDVSIVNLDGRPCVLVNSQIFNHIEEYERLAEVVMQLPKVLS